MTVLIFLNLGTQKIHRYLSMDAVLAVVEKETGMSQVLLSTGTTRQVVMTALYNFPGPNNREIKKDSYALGLILVTGNVKEFSRSPDLVIDNWLL